MNFFSGVRKKQVRTRRKLNTSPKYFASSKHNLTFISHQALLHSLNDIKREKALLSALDLCQSELYSIEARLEFEWWRLYARCTPRHS